MVSQGHGAAGPRGGLHANSDPAWPLRWNKYPIPSFLFGPGAQAFPVYVTVLLPNSAACAGRPTGRDGTGKVRDDGLAAADIPGGEYSLHAKQSRAEQSRGMAAGMAPKVPRPAPLSRRGRGGRLLTQHCFSVTPGDNMPPAARAWLHGAPALQRSGGSGRRTDASRGRVGAVGALRTSRNGNKHLSRESPHRFGKPITISI